jgi:hypothetical protein
LVLIGGGAAFLAVWFGTKVQRAKSEDEMYNQFVSGNTHPRPDGPPDSVPSLEDLGVGPSDIDVPDSQLGAFDEVEGQL